MQIVLIEYEDILIILIILIARISFFYNNIMGDYNMFKGSKGFTLIELLVVIAIIGILAAVIAPNAFKAIEKSKVAAIETDYKAVKSATLMYYADAGTWPDADNDFNKATAEVGAFIDGLHKDGSTSINGWDGPYLEKWPTKNPWGGTYTLATNVGGTDFNTYLTLGANKVVSKSAEKVINDLGDEQVETVDASVIANGSDVVLLFKIGLNP